MSLFKRRSKPDDAAVPDGADALPDDEAQADDVPAPRSGGPYDASEVEGPGARLDVGALWLPLVDGVELQLQLDEATGQVTGVFVVLGGSAVQLQAFAAPRSEGIWREIADEIAAGITEQGGTADPLEGPFGHELLARVPQVQPDGRGGFQQLRFTGVDGPRWLLRAVFHGQAAVDPDAAAALEALVADVVVVRGGEPMGPRELLPLHLPEIPDDADDADEADEADGAAGADDLDLATLSDVDDDDEADMAQPQGRFDADDLRPFERGPEITERR